MITHLKSKLFIMTKNLIIVLLSALLLLSCREKPVEAGEVQLKFTHSVDLEPIKLNLPIYENAAGNQYQVNEIKYFISQVAFIKEDGQVIKLKEQDQIHYCDLNYENTLTWQLPKIEEGRYKAITFVFGLDEVDNISNRFVNPPETNFSWSQVLGGGYHYLQINGKWLSPQGELKNMNFHTGIGQLYKNNVITVDSIYAFIHNYFTVNLPCNFSVNKKTITILTLDMNVQQWFENPVIYDHNYFGSGIMQNQEAQSVIKENGKTVFSAKSEVVI